MELFKAIKKLITYLTKEKNAVKYEYPLIPERIENETIHEEIIVGTQIESESVVQVRDWVIGKIELLHDADRHRNAKALAAEFDEWINIPEGVEELEYLCLEEKGWTDEEEMDVKTPTS